jgi:hypothetical protein
MVLADPRSSLRRAGLRGQPSKLSGPSSNSPIVDDTPLLLLTTSNEGNGLRNKRPRTNSLLSTEPNLKRRRLSSQKIEKPQLRIPLRSRGAPAVELIAKAISPTTPKLPPKKSQQPPTQQNTTLPRALRTPLASPLVSPGEKPQYDQIRIIEEKAKAAIRKSDGTSSKQEDRRKLRSEDGSSRAKTELAQYFPDFEEMLSLKPPDPGTCLSVHICWLSLTLS